MTINVPDNSALIIIDVQKAWDSPVWGKRNNPCAEQVISVVLDRWRERKLPVIHVRHDSLIPSSLLRHGKPGFEFKDQVKPMNGELQIVKHVNSAFIGTDLEKILRESGIKTAFICGLTTDHCVSTTARMSGNLGFDTYVIEDACATHARVGTDGSEIPPDIVHRVNLASLDQEFAHVLNSSELSFPE